MVLNIVLFLFFFLNKKSQCIYMNIPGSNHSYITEEDIMHLHERFHELAKTNPKILDKSYHVTKKYFSFITLEQLKDITIELGYNPSVEELNDVAGEMNNQPIDFIYFLVIIGRIYRIIKSNKYRDELKDAFDLLDLNHNGVIELSELITSMSLNTKITRKEIREIFYLMDKNHDDVISRAEFLEFINL